MDRHPYPAPPSRWIGWRPSPAAAALMAIGAGVFLLGLLPGATPWIQHLALSPERALGPEPWQLLTSAFVHGDARSLVIDLIGIWFLGSAVEQQLGRRGLLASFFVGQGAGSIVAAAMGRVYAPGELMAGCAFGIAGLLAALAVACWSLPLSLFGAPPVRGRWVAILLVALTVGELLWRSQWVHLGGTLAGLGVTAAVVLIARAIGRRPTKKTPRTPGPGEWERLRLWRLRRKYRVISGGLDRRRA